MTAIRRTLSLCLVLAAAITSMVVPARPAKAAFPGRNGLIAWTHPTSLTTDAEIFVMSPNGKNKRQLSDNGQNDFFPAWSPDGRWLAFESSSATDVDVWVMSLDGTVSKNIDERSRRREPRAGLVSGRDPHRLLATALRRDQWDLGHER